MFILQHKHMSLTCQGREEGVKILNPVYVVYERPLTIFWFKCSRDGQLCIKVVTVKFDKIAIMAITMMHLLNSLQ